MVVLTKVTSIKTCFMVKVYINGMMIENIKATLNITLCKAREFSKTKMGFTMDNLKKIKETDSEFLH